MISPIIDELYTEFGKAVISKVNVDEAASISSKYGIRIFLYYLLKMEN